jgi:hypothetical protein
MIIKERNSEKKFNQDDKIEVEIIIFVVFNFSKNFLILFGEFNVSEETSKISSSFKLNLFNRYSFIFSAHIHQSLKFTHQQLGHSVG